MPILRRFFISLAVSFTLKNPVLSSANPVPELGTDIAAANRKSLADAAKASLVSLATANLRSLAPVSDFVSCQTNPEMHGVSALSKVSRERVLGLDFDFGRSGALRSFAVTRVADLLQSLVVTRVAGLWHTCGHLQSLGWLRVTPVTCGHLRSLE